MSLQPYVQKKVMVLTSDGRSLVGTLLSCDQLTNMVLSNTIERIIRPYDDPEKSREVEHGLYLLRGDTVAIVGLVDEELDARINWSEDEILLHVDGFKSVEYWYAEGTAGGAA
ncbi:MAG: hypothetical protein M1823_001663 [Watsoniomyces obsoletus]|nr:MAG: hypothetical protein M1823_001663 [Watsoniomyces obsoletus]